MTVNKTMFNELLPFLAMKDEEEAKRQFETQFLNKPGIVVIGMPPTKQ